MAKIVDINSGRSLDKFFSQEREKVVRYLTAKYNLSLEEAMDCFQEGCIALWLNIRDGKLTSENLTCSLSSYLMRCCCNHATHILCQKKFFVDVDDPFLRIKTGIDEVDDEGKDTNDKPEFEAENSKGEGFFGLGLLDRQILKLEGLVKNMPEPCRTILWNVYFNYHELIRECQNEESIMDIIALILGMKKTVLKTTKARCMNKAKEAFKPILLNV